MSIETEKVADGSFIIKVPCKAKKNDGSPEWRPDVKYTAKSEDEAIVVIRKALAEIEAPDDELGIAWEEATKEEK